MRKTRGGCYISFHVVQAFLLLAFVDLAFTQEEPPPPGTPVKVERTSQAHKPPRTIDYRLPTAVTPLFYELHLTLHIHGSDPNKFKVEGTVDIMFQCHVVTNNVTLNVNNLLVDRDSFRFAAVGVAYPRTANYQSFETVEGSQQLVITLKEYLNCGVTYGMTLSFNSSIRNTPEGIFYGSYQTQKQTQYFVATKFEPIHARKAFPCFDEPHMKTTYRLTIVRPSDYITVGNTDPGMTKKEILVDGFRYQEDAFEINLNISTYSLAFAVGKFFKTPINDTSGYKVSVYSLEQNAKFSRYVEDLAAKLLKLFGSYFDGEQYLRKQDFVALPSSVASPNYGLKIYSDSRLLYNESDHTEEDKQLVASTVSYAAARQFFGAEITPEWWSYLWLVEGLAGYFEHLGIESVESEWKTWEHFVLDKLHVALLNDGSLSSRPVHREVQEPEAIEDMYDWVAYKKAPSLLRMVSLVVEPKLFKGFIKDYYRLTLNTVTYNQVLADLMKPHVLDPSMTNLKGTMEQWILQMNYPVVTVIRDFNDKDVVHVTQNRFLSDPKAKDPGFYKSSYKYRWTIPLTFTSSKELDFDKNHKDVYWLNNQDHAATITLKEMLPDINDKDGWILANVKQYGYYRVNYQIGNWEALSRQLKKDHTKIDSINRAQIINDAWNLARAYYLPLETALSTIEYLDKERDYLPWYTARRELRFLESMMAKSVLYKAFQAFIRDKTEAVLREFGLLTDLKDHMQILTRSLVADLACKADADEFRSQALKEYLKWMKTKTNGIPVNARKAVYCGAIAISHSDEFAFALQELKTAKFDSQKYTLLDGMSCSNLTYHINILLDLLLVPDIVLSENQAVSILTSVLQNRFGREEAWEFYRSYYKELTDKFASFKCSNMLPAIVEMFHTENELQEVNRFLAQKCPQLKSTIKQQCVDKIQTNIDLVKQNKPIIEKWLKDKGYHNK
ncbi:hypothetical protein BsWGS_03975 [Bradybaena similaris]